MDKAKGSRHRDDYIFTMGPDICRSSVGDLIQVTLLAPRNFKWLLDFCNSFASLRYNISVWHNICMYQNLVSKVNTSMSGPRSEHSVSRTVAIVVGQWITCGIRRADLLRVCQVTRSLFLLQQSVLRFAMRSSSSLILSAAIREQTGSRYRNELRWEVIH